MGKGLRLFFLRVLDQEEEEDETARPYKIWVGKETKIWVWNNESN